MKDESSASNWYIKADLYTRSSLGPHPTQQEESLVATGLVHSLCTFCPVGKAHAFSNEELLFIIDNIRALYFHVYIHFGPQIKLYKALYTLIYFLCHISFKWY